MSVKLDDSSIGKRYEDGDDPPNIWRVLCRDGDRFVLCDDEDDSLHHFDRRGRIYGLLSCGELNLVREHRPIPNVVYDPRRPDADALATLTAWKKGGGGIEYQSIGCSDVWHPARTPRWSDTSVYRAAGSNAEPLLSPLLPDVVYDGATITEDQRREMMAEQDRGVMWESWCKTFGPEAVGKWHFDERSMLYRRVGCQQPWPPSQPKPDQLSKPVTREEFLDALSHVDLSALKAKWMTEDADPA